MGIGGNVMTLFQMLMDILGELYQLQLEMLDLSKQKKQVLIEGNIQELSKIIRIESNWVKKVGKLEEERMKTVQKILEEKGLKIDDITMADLIKIFTSPKDKEQLQNMMTKLTESIEEIKKMNDLNTLLVQQSLDYIDHTFAFLTEVSNPSAATYSNPNKQAKVNQRQNIFDQKA